MPTMTRHNIEPAQMNRRIMLARVRDAMANGFSATRLGYLAVGDPMFVPKLKAGHPFRISTLWRAYDTINEFDVPRRAWVARGQRKMKVAQYPEAED